MMDGNLFRKHQWSNSVSVTVKVYFVDDPEDPEWKVVRYKDPRSRRVTGGLPEASLSAPGRPNATFYVNAIGGRDQNIGHVSETVLEAEPVLDADVEHVMAHEESDDDHAYDDVDHEDDLSEGDEGDLEQINTWDTPMDDVIDDR